ncbi:transcription factor GTE9 [Zea mays]|uniref:transcription factor GTE9 n=1 Tax=Zea mays TaxID=4577 RepID=UPI001652E143|nr:transcription factor GTE9-like [Zea mays]
MIHQQLNVVNISGNNDNATSRNNNCGPGSTIPWCDVQREMKNVEKDIRVATKRNDMLSAKKPCLHAELMLLGVISLLLSQTARFISEICVPSSLFTSRFYICSESDYQDLLRNTDANQTAFEYYSDSSSSSGSDTDAKAPQQNRGSKEKVLSVDGVDQEKDNISCTNPISVSADGEGGNVSEKQVSPDKQIRAALLRSRFADTILKAREKALDQTTKKDPEKLRREREELERVQREERARLQAEAKAAEDVRKRVEAAAAAEAAAEAKRQRELEREAARKALQEMEKTVDINEGSHFLKDLEMLGSVTGEQIPNLVGETSPGFQMGSNTLEKLGLYMKNDEDDEDGDFTDEPVSDVEEGEID